MEVVFKLLSDKGLRVNAEKSTFCAEEIMYLGYWISKSGIQPIPKKVETIKNMVRSTTRSELLLSSKPSPMCVSWATMPLSIKIMCKRALLIFHIQFHKVQNRRVEINRLRSQMTIEKKASLTDVTGRAILDLTEKKRMKTNSYGNETCPNCHIFHRNSCWCVT
jgi:hypothetical protein